MKDTYDKEIDILFDNFEAKIKNTTNKMLETVEEINSEFRKIIKNNEFINKTFKAIDKFTGNTKFQTCPYCEMNNEINHTNNDHKCIKCNRMFKVTKTEYSEVGCE